MSHKNKTSNGFAWQLLLVTGLLLFSALIYLLHFIIFNDAKYIAKYLIGHVGFVPLEVLLASFVIHKLLDYHEKRSMLKKLNMVIGVFFSEFGSDILRNLTDQMQPKVPEIIKISEFSRLDKAEIKEFKKSVPNISPNFELDTSDWLSLKVFLKEKRNFLLMLLENPNLLEHQVFTDALWAILHVNEELEARESLADLPESDVTHLKGDLKRAYTMILSQWLTYMEHLKSDYPHLYSLAVRTNPFMEKTSAIVK